MIQCTCEQCGGKFPMNDTLRVRERVLCTGCCERIVKEQHPQREDLQRPNDPTVCANCRKDNGTVELPLLAGVPVCGPCEAFFRNRPFPLWTKLALAAVLALMVVSVFWNMRFYRAYTAFHRFETCWSQGQLEPATTQISSVAALVPELRDLRILATFFQGLVLLRQDKNAEALEKLVQCKDRLPAQYQVEWFLLQAKSGAAFDAKDYDGFLAAAQTLDKMRPADPICKAELASALACKYAVTGDTGFREQAILCLAQAEEMAKDNPEFKEYDERIRYRLHSREIITSKEFHERFPNGWTEPKEK
jgi:hypothetical protein